MHPEPLHPKPTPSVQPHPQPAMAPKPKKSPLPIVAAAVVALAASSFFFGVGPLGQHAGDSHGGGGAPTSQQVAGHTLDVQSQCVLINLNDPTQVAKAQAAMNLAPSDAQRVIDDAKKGKFQLGIVSVWKTGGDDHGEAARVSSQGLTTQIMVHHAPTTVVLPVIPGTFVTVTRLSDGQSADLPVDVPGYQATLPPK